MRNGIIACLALLLYACQLDYEDNERLLIKGSVNRGFNMQFPNLPVAVFATSNGGVFGNRQRVGAGLLAADGTFNIVALSPKNASTYDLMINNNAQVEYLPKYSSLTIKGFDFLDAKDFTYSVLDGFIDTLVNVQFEIRRLDNTSDSLQYSLRYKNSNQLFNYSQTPSTLTFSNEKMITNILPPQQLVDTVALTNLIANDTLIFEYTILNADNVQTGEEPFFIKPDDNIYVFEF